MNNKQDKSVRRALWRWKNSYVNVLFNL